MTSITLTAEPNSHETLITRVFEAPRELVFKVCMDPALVPKWWGMGTTVDRMEPRPGGTWRFVSRDPAGNEYGFHGVYHAVESLARVVNTFEFEGMPGHILLETITFEEQDGKTTLTNHSVFQSVADRDGMLSSGMEAGATASMDRLAELLQAAQNGGSDA